MCEVVDFPLPSLSLSVVFLFVSRWRQVWVNMYSCVCLCVCECLHPRLCDCGRDSCHGLRGNHALPWQPRRKPLPYMGMEEESSCRFTYSRRRGGWMKQGISSPPPPPPPHCSAPSHSLHMFQRSQVADFYTNTFLNSLWHAKDGFLLVFARTKRRKKISILACYSVKLIQEGIKELVLFL